SLLPWISAIETRNGTRLPSQNQTASALARAHGKVSVAGSDSHTYRGIGRTYMVSERAHNREEFLAELRQGRVRVEGAEGCYLTPQRRHSEGDREVLCRRHCQADRGSAELAASANGSWIDSVSSPRRCCTRRLCHPLPSRRAFQPPSAR